MDFFKKALSSVSHELKDIKSKGKEAIQKIEQKIQSTISEKPATSFETDVIHVMDRIYWMNFPSADKIASLSKYLNSKFSGQYYIWNVSEHKYEVFPFNNQVAEHNMPGYPTPTLYEIFMICKSIFSWLDSDPENVAIVHCQNTRGRSALIISCLLCLKNRFQHSGEALTYFCEQTRTKDFKILFPSQQLYMNYFANVMNGLKLSNKKLKLKKIIFSEVPRIGVERVDSDDISFRPYIQIFKDSKILFNSLNSGRVASYNESDLSIWFDLAGTEASEDILIRCKHYESNKLRFPVFRMMLHTGFTQDNILRLLKTDIDFTENVFVSDSFFIDVFFEESNSTQSKAEQEKTNLDYIVDECRRKQASHLKNHKESSNEEDAQVQIEKILQSSQTSTIAAEHDQAVFSIGDHPELSEKEKQNQEEEERKSDSGLSDDSNPDNQKESVDGDEPAAIEGQAEDKLKAQQLLLKDKTIDVELDDQEIDDYLDNLEKSDDES